MFLPLLARANSIVNVPVATRVSALSTYKKSEQPCRHCAVHTEAAAKPKPPAITGTGLLKPWRSETLMEPSIALI